MRGNNIGRLKYAEPRYQKIKKTMTEEIIKNNVTFRFDIVHFHKGVNKMELFNSVIEYWLKNKPKHRRNIFFYKQNTKRLIRCVERPIEFNPLFTKRGNRKTISPMISYADVKKMHLLKYTNYVKVVFDIIRTPNPNAVRIMIITAFPTTQEIDAPREPDDIIRDADYITYMESVQFWKTHVLIKENKDDIEEEMPPMWYLNPYQKWCEWCEFVHESSWI